MIRIFNCRLILAGVIVVSLIAGSVAVADETTAHKKQITISDLDETLIMEWPEEGKWKSGLIHDQGQYIMEFFYPKDQSKNDWKEMGVTEIEILMKEENLIGRARMVFLGTQQGSPDATWDILSKGKDKNDNRFVLIKIVCPSFLSKEAPQIQYWKLLLGKTKLFTVQYSYKGTEISKDKEKEILAAINKSEIKAVKKKVEGESGK